MADDDAPQARPPMNVFTAMLLLSFVAIAIGCILLWARMHFDQMLLSPP